MSDNRTDRKKIPDFYDQDAVRGVKRDPGPYIGVVQNNVDPNRSGRLSVFIPDFGGNQDNPAHWVTVSCANPFMGATRRSQIKNRKSPSNTYEDVNHSYGMWFAPPDIGNHVLVTFVAGNINKGYWIGCVMPDLSQYAIPGLAGSVDIAYPPDDPILTSALKNPPYPVTEFNEENEELLKQREQFLTIKKPLHKQQVKVLLEQGLEDDKVRGVISSSSQRESPSQVFGISTPGRPSEIVDADNNNPLYRHGGHTFVMDDGDEAGTDKMIRLRTAGGHQILMSDSDEVLYIANSAGTAWMEFTDDGKIHMFAGSDINIRSQGTINMHSDKDIKMFAKDNIKMFAGTSIQEQSELISLKAITELNQYGGKIGVTSGSVLNMIAATQGHWGSGQELVFSSSMIYLNTKAANQVIPPPHIPVTTFKDTGATMDPPYFKWVHGKIKVASGEIKDYSTSSIVTTLPTHEPWATHHAPGVLTGSTVTTGSGGNLVDSSGNKVTFGTSGPGPAAAAGKGVSRAASSSDLAKQPPNTSGVGSLSAAEATALKTQIAKSESGGLPGGGYAAENQLGYLGKYQFGSMALQDQKYIKPGTSNRGMSNPANWTGKDGITSKEAFWAAHDLQEKIMDNNLNANYKTMLRLGTITSSAGPEDVAGKLSVAHLLGAGGANSWNKGQGGQDANGTTGTTYYNRGRYAIEVLAKNGPSDTTA